MTLPILSTILFTPIVGALILILIPNTKPQLIKIISLVTASIALLLSVSTYFRYHYKLGGMQMIESHQWIRAFDIRYGLAVDGLSIAMVILTAVIFFTGVLITWDLQERVKEFFFYMLVLVGGVFGVFMSTDLILMFVFLEIAVIPKFILIHIWGSGQKEYSALKYTLYLLAGSIFSFIAIMIIFLLTGTTNIIQLSLFSFSIPIQKTLFFLILLGFGVIVPMWPLHRWTPDGHSSAPTAISMLLAGVIMKLGGYALIRIGIGFFPAGAVFWAPLIALIATINCVYIALVAMVQKDLKYVVANSSISHMGYVLMGIAALNTISITGAAAQMFSHGIMAALFFALVGIVYKRTHTRILADLGGLAHQMPKIATLFLITGLASLGLPGMFNFVSEFLIFAGSFRVYPFLTTISILAVVITAIYVLKVVQQVFFGPRLKKWDKLTDITTIELIPVSLLAGILIWFGLNPAPIISALNNGVDLITIQMLRGIL